MERKRGPRQRRPGPVQFELLPDGADHEHPVVVEVLPDDGASAVVPPSVGARAARSAWAWLRARSPRQLAAGVVVVALAVTTGAAEHVQRGREQAARIALAPGGVHDLSAPVGERWSTELPAQDWGPGGWHSWFVSHTRGVLTVLDGGVVVVAQADGSVVEEHFADGASSSRMELDGWDLHGVDLGTGELLWTHHVPGSNLECSHSIFAWNARRESPVPLGVAPERDLACITGQGADARVLVMDSAGVVTERRPAGTREHTVAAMGPQGTLWVADRLEGEGGTLMIAEDLVAADLRLRAEDARSGEAQWEIVLPAQSGVGWCDSWDQAGDRFLSEHLLWLSLAADPGAMLAHGCGVAATISASGEVLSSEGDTGLHTSFRPLADGGVLRIVEDEYGVVLSGELVDEHGALVETLGERQLLEPWTTDGRGGANLRVPFADRGDAGRFFWRDGRDVVATTPQGEEAWRVTREDNVRSVVARAGDVVVVHTTLNSLRGSHLVAFDQRTGELRWEVPLEDASRVFHQTALLVGGAWTDGEVLVVVTPALEWGAVSPLIWTAHDLRTGGVLWQVTDDSAAPPTSCLAVDGRLLCQHEDRLVRMA